MEHAGPGRKGRHDLQYDIYFILLQNLSKDAITFVYEGSSSQRSPRSQNVPGSGFVHFYSPGSESMDSESDCSEDNVKVNNGSDKK